MPDKSRGAAGSIEKGLIPGGGHIWTGLNAVLTSLVIFEYSRFGVDFAQNH
jgi:hypothetical protein